MHDNVNVFNSAELVTTVNGDVKRVWWVLAAHFPSGKTEAQERSDQRQSRPLVRGRGAPRAFAGAAGSGAPALPDGEFWVGLALGLPRCISDKSPERTCFKASLRSALNVNGLKPGECKRNTGWACRVIPAT